MIISPSTTNWLEVLRTTLLHNFSFIQNRQKTRFNRLSVINSRESNQIQAEINLSDIAITVDDQPDLSKKLVNTDELTRLELRLIVSSSYDELQAMVNEDRFEFSKNSNIARVRLGILDKINTRAN